MSIWNRNMEVENMGNEHKQNYERPVMEITLFETEDVITTSSDEEIEL